MHLDKSIAYYVSAHGYGHGVRSCDILRALRLACPERPIHIVSGLGENFFRTRLGSALGPADTIRQAAFDVGMVQPDAIRTDVEATRERVLALCGEAEKLIASEQANLERNGIAAVVADIPGIPLAAAKRAGIPAIAVGNFSWDWIYAPFLEQDPRWLPAVEHFRDCYAQADLLLQLPFPCDMPAFRRIETIPLLATPGTGRRLELAERTGAASDRTWVLLSFVSLQWEEGAIERMQRLPGHEFFVVEPFDWPGDGFRVIDPKRVLFADVLASVDVVVSKPGFGIVSECIANAKPLIYADRADFREYPVLVEAIRRHLRQVHIPSERLYGGDLAEALAQLAGQPAPTESLANGGAAVAARRIAELARGGSA
jgi:L-arabinokinase